MRLTDEKIQELYKENNTPSWVISHCSEVSRVAVAIGNALNEKGCNLDIELIRVAGLIHDYLRVEEHHDKVAGEELAAMGYTEEADIVKGHMRYTFNPIDQINEADVMCLADRVVKEDQYVGIDDRVDYLIHKKDENPVRTQRLLKAKAGSKEYIHKIETLMGRSLDSLFFEPTYIIESKLNKALKRVEKPARYIGGEKGIVIKESDNLLRFAFAFPDLYEIGMSYLGLEILYNIVNKEEDLYLERVFQPAPDMANIMREEDLPLFTLETKTPVSNMDVFGFTLQYEMSFTNILDMLNLAGIPLLAKDRTLDHPLIIAGGPCAYNPEPLSDFIDVFLIGDGENLLPIFLKEYKKFKDEGGTKAEFLQRTDLPEGIYIPSQYEVIYDESGVIKGFKDLIIADGQMEDIPSRRTKRSILPEIQPVDFPTEPIVPFIEAVHDRAAVEAFRGCTRGCRFCQAGMIYRPVRERSQEKIIDIAMKQIQNTGNEELSLLSLSSSDHSQFETLAMDLAKRCSNANVALSLPSLRLDSFSFTVLQEIQKYRKSGLTFAPEAGTQRLRDVINKGITEEDIYGAVSQAIDLGWTHIKLYFMIGLPTETYEDLDGIADIARNIMNIKREKGGSIGRFSVTVSVSNFVPKAHTPFQWAPQDTAQSFREKHNYLRDKLRIKGVTFNYHDDDTSVLEAIIARGDRRVGKLLARAYELGCKMDSWSEHFHREVWDQAMEETGVKGDFYAFRTRDLSEVLPWDIIDSSIDKSFLISEWEKAQKEETTHDCRLGCVNCGINKRTKCFVKGGSYDE